MDARSIALLTGVVGVVGFAGSSLLLGVDALLQSPWTMLQAAGLLLGGVLLIASALLDTHTSRPDVDSLLLAGLAYLVLGAGMLATVGTFGRDAIGILLALVAAYGSLWFFGFGLLHFTGRVSSPEMQLQ